MCDVRTPQARRLIARLTLRGSRLIKRVQGVRISNISRSHPGETWLRGTSPQKRKTSKCTYMDVTCYSVSRLEELILENEKS